LAKKTKERRLGRKRGEKGEKEKKSCEMRLLAGRTIKGKEGKRTLEMTTGTSPAPVFLHDE